MMPAANKFARATNSSLSFLFRGSRKNGKQPMPVQRQQRKELVNTSRSWPPGVSRRRENSLAQRSKNEGSRNAAGDPASAMATTAKQTVEATKIASPLLLIVLPATDALHRRATPWSLSRTGANAIRFPAWAVKTARPTVAPPASRNASTKYAKNCCTTPKRLASTKPQISSPSAKQEKAADRHRNSPRTGSRPSARWANRSRPTSPPGTGT
mmetsp:Transcript_24642/g.61950  ORF Transcript_24642/g.61950 Transcript_24642/m.61950 type:complete len:212 (+) Transcript_24642:2629-3264(+)